MNIPGYYEYCNKVKLISGHEVLEATPIFLQQLNAEKPLLITDKGVRAAGLADTFMQAAGLENACIFDNVPADSDLQTIKDIAETYRQCRCDSIIALGGGSVIDTAKGVNILVSLGGNDLMKYAGAGKVKSKLKPLIVIPTTSGTGSELTLAAVIADHKHNIKLGFVSYNLLPDIALLDSRMTLTLPAHLTALTAMDALTHACEAYTCLAKNPMSDSAALLAVRLISNNLLKAIENPHDKEARLALANASALAGAAFSNSMVGMVHTLGHATGGVCQVPHGTCMSIFLPYGLEYNLGKTANLTAELLYPLAGEEVFRNTHPQQRAAKSIAFIRNLNQQLHELTQGRHPRFLKEITDRGGQPMVPHHKLADIARTALGDASQFYNPEELDYSEYLMVLEHAWEGKVLDIN